MTKHEAFRRNQMIRELRKSGVGLDDGESLRRISLILHRWHELECGTGDGHIERDEASGVVRFFNARARYVDPRDPRASCVVRDMETGALNRLAKIMARYPSLTAYVQGDPRRCALYILRPGDVPDGANAESYYTRGIAVY